MTNESLIELFENARNKFPRQSFAWAEFDKAIVIVRHHQTEQQQEVVERVAMALAVYANTLPETSTGAMLVRSHRIGFAEAAITVMEGVEANRGETRIDSSTNGSSDDNAEVLNCLKWYVENDDVNQEDPDNQFRINGFNRAKAAIIALGEANPKLADARLDASEAQGSAASAMEETSPASHSHCDRCADELIEANGGQSGYSVGDGRSLGQILHGVQEVQSGEIPVVDEEVFDACMVCLGEPDDSLGNYRLDRKLIYQFLKSYLKHHGVPDHPVTHSEMSERIQIALSCQLPILAEQLPGATFRAIGNIAARTACYLHATKPVMREDAVLFAKWCYRNAEYMGSTEDWQRTIKHNAKAVLEAANVRYVE